MVTSAAPKPEADTAKAESQDAGDENASEWTRLRILEDCEVNGVRFPKTVIIDVKSEDAAKLIENGNAELIEEKPAEATTDADAGDAAIAADTVADEGADADAGDSIDVPAVQADTAEAAAPSTAEAETAVEAVEMWPVMLMDQRMICPSWPPHSPSQKTTTQKMSCRILPLP